MSLNMRNDYEAEPTQEMIDEMDKYGIIRFPVYYFQYGSYRYTNLKDAVAQAKRHMIEE